MSPPQSYKELSKILIDEEDPATFVKHFKQIATDEEKEAVLFYEYYEIYASARYNVDRAEFDAHIKPHAKNFHQHQLNNLFRTAEEADYPIFARYFATVPIQERLTILLNNNAALYELLKSKLNHADFGGVLSQLLNPLPNPDDSPLVQRICLAQKAFNNGEHEYFAQLIYEKQDPEPSPEPLQLHEIYPKLELLAEGGKYQEIVNLFASVPDKSRIQLLAAEEGRLYKTIYANFSEQQVLELLSSLPQNCLAEDENSIVRLISETSVAYQSNTQKSKIILGKLFLRATSQACMNREIVKLPIYMTSDDFISFIQKQSTAYLLSNYTLKEPVLTERSHPLYDLLLCQGSAAVLRIIERIYQEQPDRLVNELCKSRRTANGKEYLYEALIKYPGAQGAKVAEMIAPKITDPERSALVLRYYKGHMAFPWKVIFALLTYMADRSRLHLLLTALGDSAQTILIESIVTDGGVDSLLDTLSLFGDPTARFLIYSQPVNYAKERRFAQNQTANSAAGALSTAFSYLPGLGLHAKQAVDSYQVDVDVSEFLLCRMLRIKPDIKPALIAMLSDLKAPQLTTLLRGPDAAGKSLFMHILIEEKQAEIIQLLAAAEYELPDNQKITDPSQLPVAKLREILKHRTDSQAIVGFVSLLALYNYIAVRGTESNDQTYQSSKDEFFLMLKCLDANRASNTIAAKLKEHCTHYPLRQAYSIPLATSSLKLGTNRHLDARNNLQDLTIPELQQGLALFEEFIIARVNRASTMQFNSLDKGIQLQFKTKTGVRLGLYN